MRTAVFQQTDPTTYGKTLWPPLPYEAWKDTLYTLHRCLQVIGKVKLAHAPFINQWWEVPLYITAKGLTTGLVPYDRYRAFQIDVDLIDHILHITTSGNQYDELSFRPRSVADFYHDLIGALKALELPTDIWPVPVEVPHPIAFEDDTVIRPYDAANVTRWWRIALQSAIVFERFRSSFGGKSSPIQFFWGSFDLAGTRFSGKKVTPPKKSGTLGRIMRYAENEENFAFGFWPGNEQYPHPAYYAYIYPEPKGLQSISLGSGAAFNTQLAECILPYSQVQSSGQPEKAIMGFLQETYQGSASLAGWDTAALQTDIPPALLHLSSGG